MGLPEPLQQVDRTWVVWRGQTLAYFGGCDYFRLASHPRVLAAARDAIVNHGLNVSASRRTTGNHSLYEQLETDLAEFFRVEAAVLLSNGYLTNLAAINALASQFTHILIDRAAHYSLVDAAKSAGAPIVAFNHRDAGDLSVQLKTLDRSARPILLTDGVFARDGAIAPLRDYAEILPSSAWMIVDDCHAAGVLGQNGRGTLEHHGIARENVVRTITLSKAFGSFGGAILCSRAIRDLVHATSPMSGATPPPLPCAAAAIESIRLLKNPELRDSLRANIKRVAGPPAQSPIIALNPADESDRSSIEAELLAHGIFPSLIHYGNGSGYFRFAISSEHSRAQLDALSEVLRSHGR